MADTYDLDPAVRIEEILNGDDIEPANRLEYFLKKAATEVPKPTSADAGKVITVNQDGDGYELAEGGGGGGADSLLVANLVYVEGENGEEKNRLDKTWRECRDADAIIIRTSTLEPFNFLGFDYVSQIISGPSLSDPTQTEYRVVYVSPVTSAAEGVTWVKVTLTTNAESGYPEAMI